MRGHRAAGDAAGLPPRVLAIAGTHSGGGAGVEATLRVYALLGVWGMTAITAVSAQNSLGLYHSQPLPPEAVAAQVEAVLGDIGADAVQIGQLVGAPTVRAVAGSLRRYPVPHRVVDPVLMTSSGSVLLDAPGRAALIREILPLATVLTPNRPEAAALLGLPDPERPDPREICRRLHSLGPRAVVLKGGHATGPATDLLYDGQGFVEFPGHRLETPHTGGTGCNFAAAIAAYLALGRELAAAVAGAKELITAAIAGGLPLGSGRGPCNPFAALRTLPAQGGGRDG